jgi:hypothetical protein
VSVDVSVSIVVSVSVSVLVLCVVCIPGRHVWYQLVRAKHFHRMPHLGRGSTRVPPTPTAGTSGDQP